MQNEQLRLPLFAEACYYECVNQQCFYCETHQSYQDVVWKHLWNSTTEDLELTPYCPSCQEEVIFWHAE